MTQTDTTFERAWKNPELNKRAVELSRAGNRWLTMGDFIAAATMMVYDKGYRVSKYLDDPVEYVVLFDGGLAVGQLEPDRFADPDLLTALLDALEAKDD